MFETLNEYMSGDFESWISNLGFAIDEFYWCMGLIGP